MTIAQAHPLDQPSRTFVRFSLWVMLLALPGLAMAAEPPPIPGLSPTPLAGRIWDTKAKRLISADELVGRALAAGVVILGETHDNPDHHALQAWMVRRLVAAGRRPVTALEMVESDHQAALDANRGDLAGLGSALDWEKRGWPSWALYRPIAEATLAGNGALVAGNLPLDSSRQIAKGTPSADMIARYGLDEPLSPKEEKAMAADIRDSHCGLMPESAIPAMVQVQRARDAAMAEVVADWATRPQVGPAVLIAGSGHARRDRGVPARLQALVPGVTPLSIAFVEVEADERDPARAARRDDETAPFDAVWFTSPAPRDDQCAQLQKQMGKK